MGARGLRSPKLLVQSETYIIYLGSMLMILSILFFNTGRFAGLQTSPYYDVIVSVVSRIEWMQMYGLIAIVYWIHTSTRYPGSLPVDKRTKIYIYMCMQVYIPGFTKRNKARLHIHNKCLPLTRFESRVFDIGLCFDLCWPSALTSNIGLGRLTF